MTKESILMCLILVSILVIGGCAQYQAPPVVQDASPPKEVKSESEISCATIQKPVVDLRCRSKNDSTYEYCTVYITPQSGFENEKGISYLLYESLSGTNKLEQVSSNNQIPFDSPKIPGTIVKMDKYNYYLEKLIPDQNSDMFVIIPYIFSGNGELCSSLKTNVFFKDALLTQ